MPEITRRELLIALNAAPDLSRSAAYRLAQELDRWSGRSPRSRPPPGPPPGRPPRRSAWVDGS